MTVKELIDILQALPNQDQRIVISGYEGGYCDISTEFEDMMLKLDVNECSYFGPHDYTFTPEEADCHAYQIASAT